jgi:uncharacterized protein (DUF2147 family)
MKKYLFLLLLLSGAAFSQDITEGTWTNQEKDGKFRFELREGKLYGKIVWLKNGEVKDSKNPDPKLREKSIVGLVFLKHFHRDGKNWKGGEIYDPKSGKTYSASIKWAGANALDVRGYVGISLVGRTTRFTRVE